jgi:acyl carrier protein
MPPSDPITAKVLAAVASVKDLPEKSVSPEQSLAELGFDSLDTMNLLFELEEAFKISIPDEDARQVLKVSDIVAGVRKLTADTVAGSTGGRAA